MSDTPAENDYPFVKKSLPSSLTWMIVYLLLPIAAFQVYKDYYSKPYDNNCIKKHELYLHGKHRSVNSKIISMAKTKVILKEKNITFNDLMLSIISKSLRQYFQERGDTTDEITMCMPYTYKIIPENVAEYKYFNMFVGLPVYLKLKDNLDDALKHVASLMKSLKNSTVPIATFVLVWLYNTVFPQAYAILANKGVSSKQSILREAQ
jgi:hypothetical protein